MYSLAHAKSDVDAGVGFNRPIERLDCLHAKSSGAFCWVAVPDDRHQGFLARISLGAVVQRSLTRRPERRF